MKKRYFTLAAGMCVALGLAGCAAKPAETTPTGEETTAAETTAVEETEETEAEETEAASNHIWGQISSIDEEAILVDNQSGNSSEGEIVLIIDPETTLVLDAVDAFPVAMEDIELGSFEAYLGDAMTMSLPPHNTPEMVIVNLPDGVDAPIYVTFADAFKETEAGKVLTTTDEEEYVLAEDAKFLPYLTKNIVTEADVQKDKKALIWLNEDEKVEKVVLFAE